MQKPYISQKIVVLLMCFILSFSSIHKLNAQEKDTTNHSFEIGLNYRPRLEIRDGTFRPLANDEKAAALISDRIRIPLNYTYGNLLSIRVSPQVVSIWGQANMVQGVENVGNKLALFESWAKVRLSSSWYAQIGRQVISLDDERFFGELDWAQGGRAHDALSIHFNKNKFEVKGYFAYNQNYKTLYNNNISNVTGNLYNTTDAFPHKWMQTVWANLPLSAQSKVTLLATNIGFQQAASSNASAPDYFSQTFGVNYFLRTQKADVQIAGYFQGGKNAVGMNTEAFSATANMNYKPNKKWNLSIGSDIISGNNLEPMYSNTDRSFNPYFQTGHKFYGFMDYYYAGDPHQKVGISDSYLKASFKAKNNLTLGMAIHQFITPNKISIFGDTYDSNLGQEMDFTFSYKVNSFVNLVGGYSLYLATPTIHFLKNVPNERVYQQWAWLSLNITPTLFKDRK